jgi:hypothetical protein
LPNPPGVLLVTSSLQDFVPGVAPDFEWIVKQSSAFAPNASDSDVNATIKRKILPMNPLFGSLFFISLLYLFSMLRITK